jgi:hypothetical protein
MNKQNETLNQEIKYPVSRLNPNITLCLSKVISANILGNIQKGLNPKIEFIDVNERITSSAKIVHDRLNGSSQVYLSLAYCQYLWLICDASLKSLDYKILIQECEKEKIKTSEFKNAIEHADKLSLCELTQLSSNNREINIDKIKSHLNRLPQLLDGDLLEKCNKELELASTLFDNTKPINFDGINSLNINGSYEQLSNSVYCYGIAFILLHELTHHELNHLNKEADIDDEIQADMAAFWDIFNDIPDSDRFSANVGMICVMLSFMMLNKNLSEDGIHPREDKRLFSIYDNIYKENDKYTLLVVNLLDLWAKNNDIKGYPMNLPPTDESIDKIKQYFKNR